MLCQGTSYLEVVKFNSHLWLLFSNDTLSVGLGIIPMLLTAAAFENEGLGLHNSSLISFNEGPGGANFIVATYSLDAIGNFCKPIVLAYTVKKDYNYKE